MTFTEQNDLLIKILETSAKVNSLDSNNEKESVRLAHAIIDMSESFKVVLEQLVPRLISNEIKSEEIEDILFDIGEELRHVMYHIRDTKFFEYLM